MLRDKVQLAAQESAHVGNGTLRCRCASVGVMEALLEEGCIIVATSNRAPWDLNRHGLHEDLFGHFVQNLLGACHPYQLSAEQDYRRLLVRGTVLDFLHWAEWVVQAVSTAVTVYLHRNLDVTPAKVCFLALLLVIGAQQFLVQSAIQLNVVCDDRRQILQ